MPRCENKFSPGIGFDSRQSGDVQGLRLVVRALAVAEILRDEIEERGRQLDDLLVGKAFALQVTEEALGNGLVSAAEETIGCSHHVLHK